MYDNRARDFSTVFAFGQTTSKDIGLTGEREPRFFSKAVVEPSFDDKSAAEIFNSEFAIRNAELKPILSVRAGNIDSAKAAVENGADVVYIGGESFKPLKPLNIEDYKKIIDVVHSLNKKVILNTPRTTYRRECSELEQLLSKLETFDDKFDGIMVSNLGTLQLAKKVSTLPIQTDLSFNLFNHKAAEFLKDNGVVMAAASLELSYTQLKSLIENSTLPIEVVVHGSFESMISDHNFPKLYLDIDEWSNPDLMDRQYALKDEAGEIHSIKIDQYNRNHIYFAKDLCLYQYLDHFMGAASLRIEAQLYSPEIAGYITSCYRNAIDNNSKEENLESIKINIGRPLGVGIYRFQQSKNS